MRWMLRPVAAVMLAALALAGGLETANAKPERPEFVVVSTEGDFEVRDYATLVVAQFTLRGTYKRSVSQGYIHLEKYFLGKNTVPEAMKITVPTMVRDDLASGWTTIFVLPRGYRAETAPRPVDRRIRIVEFPARRVAAIVFPGKLGELVMREQAARLDAWLAAKGIAHRGDFTWPVMTRPGPPRGGATTRCW